MSARLITFIMAFAYRRARAYGGRLWWIVLAVAALVRFMDRREEPTRVYRVKDGDDIDVAVRRVS